MTDTVPPSAPRVVAETEPPGFGVGVSIVEILGLVLAGLLVKVASIALGGTAAMIGLILLVAAVVLVVRRGVRRRRAAAAAAPVEV